MCPRIHRVGLSVHRSVCQASVNIFQHVKTKESQEESHILPVAKVYNQKQKQFIY